MLKSQIFFSLCDTTKRCPSLFIHQQAISTLCLHRTPLDPQIPPRLICCSQPGEVAGDLVQSNSELFCLTPFSVGMLIVSINLFSSKSLYTCRKSDWILLQTQLWNFPSLAQPQNDLMWVKFMMYRQLIFRLVFSRTEIITSQSFILDWNLLSWSTDPSQATAKASTGGHTEE